MLILSLYKTRCQVFFNKEGLARTWRPMWDVRMGLVGSTYKDYGGLHGENQKRRDLLRFRANLEF